METARREFLRIYRLEVAKTILVTVVLVVMIVAGGILMQSRISLENEIRRQRADILLDLDRQVKEQSEVIIERGRIIEDLNKQILKTQKDLVSRHDDINRLTTQVNVLGDLIRQQSRLIDEKLHK